MRGSTTTEQSEVLGSLDLDVATSAHRVQFYEDDGFLIDAVARFVGGALRAGDAAIVIATEPHRKDLDERLAASGFDLSGASTEGRYVAFDALETLSKFMRDGHPDETLFTEVIGGAIEQAAGSGPTRRVRAFGEMVALLCADGRPDAAVRLEKLWNDLGRKLSFSLLCAYPIRGFQSETDAAFGEICSEHSRVVPAETFPSQGSDDERLRAVARLQQKAHALDTEIVHRQNAERTIRARDETLQKLYEAERRARAEAEDANRAKDEFLAMLGHELRNPLSAIRNAIVSARLDESRRERALDIAQRQADSLGRLVDDLLDVGRITQGRIPLRRQTIRFAGIVERAVETTRSVTEDRAHAVKVSLRCADLQVNGDPTRLEQVVVNLLTNAARYTDPGGQIEIVAESEGKEVVLRVRDNGIGISAETLPRVFDLFVQGKRALDRAPGGLGIGLTVARRLVELHGGHIEAKSDGHGKGAEFIVRLPALPAEAESVADRSPEKLQARARTRVIIVEDNSDAAESLMMLLELLGHQVRVIGDGDRAIAAASANVPDVMLIDIGLPGIDGYEVAQRIRHDPALRHITLVALTGYGSEEDKQRAIDVGFDYHLVKPVDPTALQNLVGGLADSRRDTDDPSTQLVH